MDYFIDFANHKDGEVFFPNTGIIKVRRGQHIFSIRKLSTFLRVNGDLTRLRLKALVKIGFLSVQSTHRYSIATVLNYDVYQSNETANDTLNATKTTQRQHSDVPKQELKELKELKENPAPGGDRKDPPGDLPADHQGLPPGQPRGPINLSDRKTVRFLRLRLLDKGEEAFRQYCTLKGVDFQEVILRVQQLDAEGGGNEADKEAK